MASISSMDVKEEIVRNKDEYELDFSRPWPYCDVVFIVEDKKLYASKVCLHLWSAYFDTLLIAQAEKDKYFVVNIEGTSFLDMLDLMKVLHHPGQPITDDNVEALLSMGLKFSITRLTINCEDYLLNKEMTLNLHELSLKYNLKRLREKFISYIWKVPASTFLLQGESKPLADTDSLLYNLFQKCDLAEKNVLSLEEKHNEEVEKHNEEVLSLEEKHKEEVLSLEKNYNEKVLSLEKNYNGKVLSLEENYNGKVSLLEIKFNSQKCCVVFDGSEGFKMHVKIFLSQILLEEEVKTESVISNDIIWWISIKSQYNKNKKEKMMGLYLNSKAVTTSWLSKATVNLVLENRNPAQSIKFPFTETFSNEDPYWGPPNFISIKSLIAPDSGYLENNTLSFEFHVKIEKTDC